MVFPRHVCLLILPLAFSLILLPPIEASGQSTGQTCNRFLVLLKSGQRLEVRNGKLGEAVLTGYSLAGSPTSYR